jgi:hypothetical protein
MRASQIAGFAVTIAVVMWADLPIGLLVLVAMLCGGLAALAVDAVSRRR